MNSDVLAQAELVAIGADIVGEIASLKRGRTLDRAIMRALADHHVEAGILLRSLLDDPDEPDGDVPQ